MFTRCFDKSNIHVRFSFGSLFLSVTIKNMSFFYVLKVLLIIFNIVQKLQTERNCLAVLKSFINSLNNIYLYFNFVFFYFVAGIVVKFYLRFVKYVKRHFLHYYLEKIFLT